MEQVVDRELLFIGTDFRTQGEVFSFLGNTIWTAGRAEKADTVIRGFYKREMEFSTCINDGVAIPHCLDPDIRQASVVIIQNNRPVAWTNEDEEADLIFALFVPGEEARQSHLRILSRLAGMLMEEEFVAAVRDCKSRDALYEQVKLLNETL